MGMPKLEDAALHEITSLKGNFLVLKQHLSLARLGISCEECTTLAFSAVLSLPQLKSLVVSENISGDRDPGEDQTESTTCTPVSSPLDFLSYNYDIIRVNADNYPSPS